MLKEELCSPDHRPMDPNVPRPILRFLKSLIKYLERRQHIRLIESRDQALRIEFLIITLSRIQTVQAEDEIVLTTQHHLNSVQVPSRSLEPPWNPPRG